MTYSEDGFLEENGLGKVGLELGLCGVSLATEELIARRDFDQLALPLDQAIVVLHSIFVLLSAVNKQVGDD